MSVIEFPRQCWQTRTPPVPEGQRLTFWCAIRYGDSGSISYCALQYLNRFKLECSDIGEPGKAWEPVEDEEGIYRASGWFEMACEACDTQWEVGFDVLAWQGLPRDFQP